jgi:predicted O-methyltransferase YrrM
LEYTKKEESVIEKLQADPKFYPASIHPQFARFLYRLVLKHKPESVFEVGCFSGYSTLHIAKALRENNMGHLYAFDMKIRKAADHIREAGLIDYVTFAQGDSGTALRECLACHKHIKIDLLFLDGDHTRRGCAADFNALMPSLREEGYLVLHDIDPATCGWKGPRMLLDYFSASASDPALTQFSIEERPDLDRFGVAVCRLTSQGKNPLETGSVYRRLALRCKISKTARAIENIKFESRMAANRWVFYPAKVRDIVKHLSLKAMHHLLPRPGQSGDYERASRFTGVDPAIRISGRAAPGGAVTVEIRGRAGSRWAAAWSGRTGPHFVADTGLTFDIGPGDLHVIKGLNEAPLYLDSSGRGRIAFKLPGHLSAGRIYIQGVTENRAFWDKTNRAVFEIPPGDE